MTTTAAVAGHEVIQAPLYSMVNPEHALHAVEEVHELQLLEHTSHVKLPKANIPAGHAVKHCVPNKKYPVTQFRQVDVVFWHELQGDVQPTHI